MNAEDIRNVTFDRVMRGYRPEEVDAYLDQVAAELEKLRTEKEDTEKKMYVLAEKVEQYRNDEETLKTALLNAQRMGESVIHEARQKAETIVYDATSKASQAREEAVEKVAEEEMALARLKAEVARFKSDVLNLYKQHIESLSMIPGAEEKRRKNAEPAEQEQDEPASAAPEAEAEPKAEESPEAAPSSQEPAGEPEEIAVGRGAAFESYQGITFEE